MYLEDCYIVMYGVISSNWQRDTYMRQEIMPSSGQMMACPLIGANPLSEPMIAYCQMDHWEQLSMEFESKHNTLYRR